MWKQVGIFLAGAAVGAGSCFIFVKKHYEKVAQEEIDSVKEYYHQSKQYSEKKEEIDIQEPKPMEYTSPSKDETVDYSEYAARKIGEQLREHIEKGRNDEHMVKHEHPTDEDTMPYIIDDKTVGNVGFYARATLIYYMGNDMLVDEESDEPIDDIQGTIGKDNLEILKAIPETTIYVRNVGYGIDYEVIKINGDWM